MYQVKDDGGELFNRFRLASARVKELGELFQNPGTQVSEDELLAWIMKADEACASTETTIRDALTSLHGGL